MTGHVAPHRWADAWAGRVDEGELADMDRHVATCQRCRRAKLRVERASDTFTTIRTKSSPDLSWDAVRARIHWSVSTERRQRVAPHRRRPGMGWASVGVVAVAGIASTMFVDRPAPPQVHVVKAAGVDAGLVPVPEPPPAKLVGLVNRATGGVMIDGLRVDPAELFDRRLAPGTMIATGDGRVDVQFGEDSAFALGPRSTLELRRFDARTIELDVVGTIDIAVAARAHDQRFLVHAGERTIEVRGTQFRVEHEAGGATRIACRHGLVAVRDRAGATGAVDVGTSTRLEVGGATRDPRPVAMTPAQLAELVGATPMTMPIWDLTALATSAPLEIATAGRREVRLDGLELGAAPMRVRVMPGRHTVEAADAAGRFRRVGWIDVAPNARRPARLDVLPEPPPTRGKDTRRRQFAAGIDRGRIATCMRAIVKSGLAAGAYVDIEIKVDAHGAINHLNVVDSDLGSSTQQCIHDALESVRFPAGPVGEWRQRIDL